MTINQLHLGNLFRSRREPGKAGLPVISVTMRDGLVHRDTLDRKDNGTLAPEEHLLVRKGDIAYNMMRMWQGASGLAETDGIVSPAYVVVIPQKDIDPLFAAYWFKSARIIYLFWAYSYGITGDRLRLYYKDFAQIPVNVPSKPEQERIGRMLATTDRAIAGMDKLIAAKRTLKKGLAQQLLTGQRRLPGFNEKWKHHKLEQVASVVMGSSPPSSAYNADGNGLPLIQGNADIRLRRTAPRIWTSIITKSCKIGDILISVRAPVGEISISDHHACIGRGMCAIRAKRQTSHEYLYQTLLRFESQWLRLSQGSTFTAINSNDMRELHIACPPTLNEQIRIAAVLDAADRGIALLEKKLAALRDLKKGLMQKLLTGPMLAKESA